MKNQKQFIANGTIMKSPLINLYGFPTGVTNTQIEKAVRDNPGYMFEETIRYPVQSGAGMREKIVLRHKDAILEVKKHPDIDISQKVYGFDTQDIEEEYQRWVKSV